MISGSPFTLTSDPVLPVLFSVPFDVFPPLFVEPPDDVPPFEPVFPEFVGGVVVPELLFELFSFLSSLLFESAGGFTIDSSLLPELSGLTKLLLESNSLSQVGILLPIA